jgi:hypothetical protein
VTQLAALSAVKTVLEAKSASGNNLSLTYLEKRCHDNKWINVIGAGRHCYWGDGIGLYLFSKLER